MDGSDHDSATMGDPLGDGHVSEGMEEPDGQRSSPSLDEDGGTRFETSLPLETALRRGCHQVAVVGAEASSCESPTNLDGFEDNDVAFDPVQRLNFDDDDDDDDEEDEEGQIDGSVGRGESPGLDDMAAFGSPEAQLQQRPIVNGSERGESNEGELDLFRPVPDSNHNVRIIEGHDSSFLDDAPPQQPQQQQANPYGFNFLHTQVVQLPMGGSISPSAGTYPNNQQVPVSEDEAHNLYDSLEREDGSSLFGPAAHSENVLDDMQQYFSSGGAMLEVNIGAAHNQHHQQKHSVIDSDDAFWEQEDNSDHGDYLSNSHSHHGNFESVGSPQHTRQQSPPRNFQMELSTSGPIPCSESMFQQLNRQSDNPEGIIKDQIQNPVHDSTEGLGAEISEEGLMHNSQTYAQPMNPVISNPISPGLTMKDKTGPAKPQNTSVAANIKSRQLSAVNSQQKQPKNLARSQPVVELSTEDAANADHRQEAAGSSGAGQGQLQMGTSGGAIPKQAQPNRAQPNRRPAVQGSASSEDSNRVVGRKSAHRAPNKHSGMRPKSGVGRGVATGNPQGRQLVGQVHSSPLASSRTNSHSSLTSNMSSSNSRVSGVGKESRLATSVPSQEPIINNRTTQHSHTMLATSQAANVSLRGSAVERIDLNQQQVSSLVHHGTLQQGRSKVISSKADFNSHHINNSSNHPQTKQMHRNHAALSVQTGLESQETPFLSGASPSGSEGSHRSLGQDSVLSQMEALRRQGQCLSPPEVVHNDVQGMEEVRSYLHNILTLGASGSFTGAENLETGSEMLLTEQPVCRELHFDTDTSSLIGPSLPGDMSDIMENFPNISKLFPGGGGGSRLDTSGLSAHSGHSGGGQTGGQSYHHQLQARNQQLRDSLEKETYRRKHCEEYIQKLNTKLLEVQQQLAVAVSTDKRKDIMIEQLDKQLAKVVEGWRKREADKDEYLQTLTLEKAQIEEALTSQQAMVSSFETELSQTVEELRLERERSSQTIRRLQEEVYESERIKESSLEQLQTEKQRCQTMTEEWNSLTEAKDAALERAKTAEDNLAQEQSQWSAKERESSAKIAEVKEATQKVINMEKVKTEEMKKKKEAAEAECGDMKAELKKTVLDIEQLLREKESQKVEMSIMEAKFESAQRKLEADMQAQMEKEIADQAAEFHSRLSTTAEELGERHRAQVMELHKAHQKELTHTAAEINAQRDQTEADFRSQIKELDDRLQEMRAENSGLRHSKLKLESQRMEILTKLQMMMQSQWNEAVSLLVNTPQKKHVNGSFLSSSHSTGELSSTVASSSDGHSSNASTIGVPRSLANNSRGDTGDAVEPVGKKSVSPAGGSAAVPTCVAGVQVETMGGQRSNSPPRPHVSTAPLTTTTTPALPGYHRGGPYPNTVRAGSFSENTSSIEFQHHSVGEDHSRLPGQSHSKYSAAENEQRSKDQHVKVAMTTSPRQSEDSSQHFHSFTSGSGFRGHQAVAMRSPQQLSRLGAGDLVNSDVDHRSSVKHPHHTSADYKFHPHHEDPTANHHYHLQQPHYHQNHPHHNGADENDHSINSECHRDRPNHRSYHPMSQQQELSTPPLLHHPNSKATDQGKKNTNINLYSPTSLSLTSSPDNGSPAAKWSSSGVPESPVKKHNKRQMTFTQNAGETRQQDMSPPVRQAAERELSDSASDGASFLQDDAANGLAGDYSRLSQRLEEHQDRQGELQHYVRMLLSKAPGSVCSEPERDAIYGDSILESSRDLTELMQSLAGTPEVDLDLTDTATALEVTSQLTRLQELRERQQALRSSNSEQEVHRQQPRVGDTVGGGIKDEKNGLLDESGVLTSQGLAEVSNLLVMYRQQWESNPESADQGNVAGRLMDALRGAAETANSTEHAKKMDSKKYPDAKASPRSLKSRKSKKVLNGSQASKQTSHPSHHDQATLSDTSASNRALSTSRRKVASGSSSAVSVGQHHHHHHHHNHHHHPHQNNSHMGIGDVPGANREKRAPGQAGQGQGKGSVGGSRGMGGAVWK